MLYFYGMRLRGFSIGCQPMEGLVRREDPSSNEFWDVIIYDRPLTIEEVRHYSLTPLYAYVCKNNLGEEYVHTYTDRDRTINNILDTLQYSYDEYCSMYPKDQVVWEDKDLVSNESKVYVKCSGSFMNCILYEPKISR